MHSTDHEQVQLVSHHVRLQTASVIIVKGNACRELFEAWCEDPRNGIIIADFAVAGTLAREVLDEPKEIMSHSGHKVPSRVQAARVATSVHTCMLAMFWDGLDWMVKIDSLIHPHSESRATNVMWDKLQGFAYNHIAPLQQLMLICWSPAIYIPPKIAKASSIW